MNTKERDVAINYLQQKICPRHLTKMVERNPFIIPGVYRRDRYSCRHCGCVVDFVGDEIKTDSVVESLMVLGQIGYLANELDLMD